MRKTGFLRWAIAFITLLLPAVPSQFPQERMVVPFETVLVVADLLTDTPDDAARLDFSIASDDAQLVPVVSIASPADIGFEMRSGSTAWLDGNEPCTTRTGAPNLGPHSMWVEIAVTNNATETLQDVTADLSGFSSPYYELTADPSRYIGSLAPDETFYGYWFVDYGGVCTLTNPHNVSDVYSVTVSSSHLTGDAAYSGALTTAQANSVRGNDVLTSSRGSRIAIGQIYTQTVEYQYSNSNRATVLVQPTGDNGFDDGCFRLVASEVSASTIGDIPAGSTDTLYFAPVDLDNGDTLKAVFYWQALCQSSSTSTPWTVVGPPKGKYSKDFGVFFTTFPTASLSLDIELFVTPTLVLVGEVVTYTVRINNSFTQPVTLHSVTKTLSAGFSYGGTVIASSDITDSNSGLFPVTGATGALAWYGQGLVSYSIPPTGTGKPGSIELVYTANVPSVPGTYTSWATAAVGSMNVGPVSATVQVEQPTSVDLLSFTANQEGDHIRITWETGIELDSAGFTLYRSETPTGEYVQLNDALIPSQSPGSVSGAVYTWVDRDVQPGQTYYYKLGAVDIDGTQVLYGPVDVALSAQPATFSLYVPLVLKAQ